jgi:2-isopropylmalate synthase
VADSIRIVDTTLASAPSLAADQARELAVHLARLGVDVLQLGPESFPSPWSESISSDVSLALNAGPSIAAIDRAWSILHPAPRARLKISCRADATSPAGVARLVTHARRYTPDVELALEHAPQARWDDLATLLESAATAGAPTVTLVDDAGLAQPTEIALLVAYLREHVADSHRLILGIDCRDDLGLAVANSLAAISAGVREVSCALTGIGPRAGSTALEELVMALTLRQDHYAVTHRIAVPELVPTCTLLQQLSRVVVPPHKAVVGSHALSAAPASDPDIVFDAFVYVYR